jgi:hypothetical protein
VVSPNFFPHLFTSEDRDATYIFEIDIDEFADSLTQLFHTEVFQLLCVPGNYPIGYVLRLEVAKVLKVLLINIPFAVFSNNLNIIKVEDIFGPVCQDFVDVKFAFILAPKKSKDFINDVRFKVFVYVSKSLCLVVL